MATALDLQEQEQIDQLKGLWKQYGNLILWTLILVLTAFSAWNGWNYWQREQSGKAAGLFEELERAASANDAERVARISKDLRDAYGGTSYAARGALRAAAVLVAKGQTEDATAQLEWVRNNAAESELRPVARLRLAGIFIEQQKWAEASKELDSVDGADWAALVADRRGDLQWAQGDLSAARKSYETAWRTFEASSDYRRLVEAKLAALGVNAEGLGQAKGGAGASS